MQRAFTKQKKMIVLAVILAFTAPAVFADTDKAELEKLRTLVQNLDQKIRAFEHKLERKNETPAPVQASANTATATPVATNTDSGITVYGKIDMSYDIISNGTSAAGAAGASKNNVSSNVSKLGFKGAEGLSDGLAAIWQIEQQINIDNSGVGNGLATRNSFLGLKSDSAGTVLLGRHDTPYKLATRKLDVFGDSIADNRALLGGVTSNTTVDSAYGAFDGRSPDIILYTTPDMSGFTGMIAYANQAEGNTTAAAAKSSLVSLAATYKVDSFYGALGYEDHEISSTAGTSESAWKLGLGYDFSPFALSFVYEKTDDNVGALGANSRGHNAYYLGGKYKMGMNAVKLAYGKADQHGATANTGGNQFSLGYDHGLSKRTKLYAIYSRISNNSASDYGFSQSTAAAGTINGIGSSPSVVSLGMQHNF